MKVSLGKAYSGLLIVMLLAWFGTQGISALFVNRGMLSISHGQRSTYIGFNGSSLLTWQLKLADYQWIDESLQSVIGHDRSNDQARWTLGRAALAAHDPAGAVKILDPLFEKAKTNPFLYLDLFTAYNQQSDFRKIIELFESAPLPVHVKVISDTLAFAYLSIQRSDSVERAASLQPSDLYTNYLLWKQPPTNYAPDVFLENLKYFELEAVYQLDQRRLSLATQVIPKLRAEGIWDYELTSVVMSYLAWQYHSSVSVEQLLQDMTRQYPDEPDWLFYLAELHQRNHDLSAAQTLYSEVLNRFPQFAVASQRLVVVAEELSNSQDRPLEVQNVAGTLPSSENLIANSSLDVWAGDVPDAWIVGDHASKNGPWNEGLCTTGRDDFAGINGPAARITCFWFKHQPDKEAGRFGLWLWFEAGSGQRVETRTHLIPGQVYRIMLNYRTQNVPDGMSRITLSDLLGSDGSLPQTQDSWRNISINKPSNSTDQVRPLINLWSPGDLWFDNVGIFEINK